mgnify:CR=1 FL=1|tara:strand:+ start:1932 stop:2216 length:285 start_codon:yes stop_codon:yes gene_type:complete
MKNRMIYQWINAWSIDELEYDMEVNTHDYEIDYKNNKDLQKQVKMACINDGFKCDALSNLINDVDIYNSIVEFITEHKQKAVRLNVEWHWYYSK